MPRTEYAPDVVAKICVAIAAGNTLETSAKAARVNPRTVREWMVAHPEFEEEVLVAEAAAEMARVERLSVAAANGKIAADMFWLERRAPQSYGRVDRVDLMLRHELAEQLAEELRREGLIGVTKDDVLREYNRLATRALPDGTRPKL